MPNNAWVAWTKTLGRHAGGFLEKEITNLRREISKRQDYNDHKTSKYRISQSHNIGDCERMQEETNAQHQELLTTKYKPTGRRKRKSYRKHNEHKEIKSKRVDKLSRKMEIITEKKINHPHRYVSRFRTHYYARSLKPFRVLPWTCSSVNANTCRSNTLLLRQTRPHGYLTMKYPSPLNSPS